MVNKICLSLWYVQQKTIVMQLTKFQRDELEYVADVRLDTIEDDIESACEFERSGKLPELKQKLIDNVMDFTPSEIKWMVRELENRIDIGESNRDCDGFTVQGYINSMYNAIKKLQS